MIWNQDLRISGSLLTNHQAFELIKSKLEWLIVGSWFDSDTERRMDEWREILGYLDHYKKRDENYALWKELRSSLKEEFKNP